MHESRHASDRLSIGRSIYRILLIVPALFAAGEAQPATFTRYEKCYLRCVAGCVTEHGMNVPKCEVRCSPYENVKLCEAEDTSCWNNCKDLGAARTLEKPFDLHVDYANSTRTIDWQNSPGATLYALQYRTKSGTFEEDKARVTTSSSLENFSLPRGQFCDGFFVRVAAIAPDGVSEFSSEAEVPRPSPSVSPLLTLVNVKYSEEPFRDSGYSANGTLIVTFSFDDNNWPLGPDDLSVNPMFSNINCQIPDFSQTFPIADFTTTNNPREIQTRIGADMMYRRCRYVYYAQDASSKKCGTDIRMYTPPVNAIRTLDINCTMVEGSPCAGKEPLPGPICGQIGNYSFEVATPSSAISSDLSLPVSVNLTFTPIVRQNEAPTLFYMAVYGLATTYDTPDQEAFLGVNQTTIEGSATNCPHGHVEGCHSQDPSLLLDNVYLDKLYGVTICAVKSAANLTLPAIPGEPKASKPKSLPLLIKSEPYVPSRTGVIVGVSVGGVGLLLFLICAFCCYRWRNMRKENEHFQIKLRQMELEKETRYIDMPKKYDIWEIDRRNVDVDTNTKLGQGAFGAVYRGRLIGASLASHDANSPLGINLMRSENCLVAIKTLPESADSNSKQEFLREIALMKCIGYHERLVNMLACVTDSEPYLLVVEYCSDGDLLRFLRDRRVYMMKLSDLGIDYTVERAEDDNSVDMRMVVTMKQLLIFSVQISYALEYLSQKGFVHRDVAARNVLVNEGSVCKIGDFGLCRQIGRDEECYKSQGGRLPLKWMSPEAIRDYEFSTKSDVWSFGVLLFEVITLGGCPYPDWNAADVLSRLEKGERMPQPDNCPDQIYSLMNSCWKNDLALRPDFSAIRTQLGYLLEEVSDEYSYLKLDSQRNYYNVQYEGDGKVDVNELPSKTVPGLINPSFSIELESEA